MSFDSLNFFFMCLSRQRALSKVSGSCPSSDTLHAAFNFDVKKELEINCLSLGIIIFFSAIVFKHNHQIFKLHFYLIYQGLFVSITLLKLVQRHYESWRVYYSKASEKDRYSRSSLRDLGYSTVISEQGHLTWEKA